MIRVIQNSTIHGVGHFYSASNKIWKIFWFLFLLTGFIGIFINMVFVVMKYLRHPVLLSFMLEYKPFVWPEITFCDPTAPFDLTNDSSHYEYWNKIIKQSRSTAPKFVGKIEKIDFEWAERALAMSSADVEKLIKMSYINDLISVGYNEAKDSLFFLTKASDANMVYLEDDLSKIISTQFVQIHNNIPCYTLNIRKLKIPNLESLESLGFYISLNHQNYEIFNSSSTSRSIYLYLTNENELPQENEIVLAPGFSTTLKLTQNHYSYLGVKKKCRKNKYNVELYDAFLKSTRVYEGSYKDCEKIVSQEIFVKHCKCYSPFLPIYKNESGFPLLCLNLTHFSESKVLENLNCMVKAFGKYASDSKLQMSLLKKCKKYKFRKCKSLSYQMNQRDNMFVEAWTKNMNKRRETVFKKYSKYSGPGYPNYLDYMRDNVIKLIILRNSKYGELYEEEDEYPFSQLLSDIGGLMGLWLGMSVVGLLELAEMFYYYLKNLCKTAIMKNQNTENQNTENQNITQ